jgi:hypothetical protein
VRKSHYSIRIPFALWGQAILQLRRRSAGNRESGAFLLGPKNGNSARVTAFICYDDLDPAAYQSGAIAFQATGYAALWRYAENGNSTCSPMCTPILVPVLSKARPTRRTRCFRRSDIRRSLFRTSRARGGGP